MIEDLVEGFVFKRVNELVDMFNLLFVIMLFLMRIGILWRGFDRYC